MKILGKMWAKKYNPQYKGGKYMAGYAIGKSMNLGFPGTYAHTDDVIMSRAVKEDSKAIPFGAPVF